MVRIRNLSTLEDKIDEDLAWRKKEIIDIDVLLDNKDFKNKNVLLRSGISLLSAHWEGFIRTASNLYVIYICDQKLINRDLKINFLALMAKKDIGIKSQSKKSSVHMELINKIENLKDEKFYIKYTENERIINTDSNLSYNLFEEILKTLNIENKYELKKNYIDRELLKKRHQVVHGEKTFLEHDDFKSTMDIIFQIMEEFKTDLIVSATNKNYLKEEV